MSNSYKLNNKHIKKNYILLKLNIVDNNIMSVSNASQSVEYLTSDSFKQVLPDVSFLNVASLIGFFGGRHVISDFYDHRPDLLCNPIIKILILFSVLYMNIKNVKLTVIIFFFYVFLVDNYIQDKCNKEYFTQV
jgi:hypothetical protein